MSRYLVTLLALTLLQVSSAGENQWVTFIIENNTSKTLYLTDVAINYGKWYRPGCKLCELETVEQTIGPDSHTIISACGRLLSPTGTDGEFSIYDGKKESHLTTQILHAYFSVPYLLGSDNILNIKQFKTQYVFESYGGSPKSAALGSVTIKIFEKERANHTSTNL